MIFDRDSEQANWMKLNKLARELQLLTYTFSDDEKLKQHVANALLEVEAAKAVIAEKIDSNAETQKIKKQFQ